MIDAKLLLHLSTAKSNYECFYAKNPVSMQNAQSATGWVQEVEFFKTSY